MGGVLLCLYKPRSLRSRSWGLQSPRHHESLEFCAFSRYLVFRGSQRMTPELRPPSPSVIEERLSVPTWSWRVGIGSVLPTFQ